MKNYLILLVALISFSGYSQISFGAKHIGKPSDLKKEDLEKFKATTTIFVLSDVMNVAEYEAILKDTWTVTPYKIVTPDQFDLLDMYKKDYSFAEIIVFKKSKTTKMGSVVHYLHTYIDIGTYNVEEITKKIAKIKTTKEEKRKKKIRDIFIENKKAVAKFYLYPTDEFVGTALSEKREVIVEHMYTKDIFYNYTSGMLKNYFQKTNSLIANGETYWMYKKDFDEESIANLASSKLYIPDYVTQKTDAWTAGISDRDEKEIEKLFKGYSYEYEFISKDGLDKAIADNSEFYYMRYTRVNAEKFVQIVNSKTGEVIFRDYITGLGYNLKAKNLEYLSKVISKANKNLAK